MMESGLVSQKPSITTGDDVPVTMTERCAKSNEGDHSESEAEKPIEYSETVAVKSGSGSGKKKTGRRPRRKKKALAPVSAPEQTRGVQKKHTTTGPDSSPNHYHQQQQPRQRQQPQQPKQQAHSPPAAEQSKPAPRIGPGAVGEINKSLSVSMMASSIFPLPFPLMPVLGITLLASQGKPSDQKSKTTADT